MRCDTCLKCNSHSQLMFILLVVLNKEAIYKALILARVLCALRHVGEHHFMQDIRPVAST